jgi:flagellar basal-body rod protein FlgF
MLDVALHEEGFLAISLPDGSEAYSRNGSIQVSPEGQLTIQGMPLLGVSGPISLPPQAEITLASDGTLSALNPGDPPNTISQVGSIKLVKAKPSEMVRGDDGLFHLTPAAQQQRGKQLPNDPSMRVTPGMLESSNVKPVETMVDLINNARRFEMQMKVIHSVDENEQRANSLLSMS